MNKYFVLIILLFFDCDPGWIYKINDQKIGDGTSLYKYKDSNSIMSVSSRDFALRTYIVIQISIRTDSVELQPLNAYFRSNHSLKNLQIPENIWFKLIRDNEIISYNRYEIPSYLIGDTVFLDYESIYNYNPDIIVTNLLKEEDLPDHSHIKYRDLLLPTIFSKHDTLKIEFRFRSFALYTYDSDSSGFLMYYNLYRNNTPIEMNFIKE